MKKNKGFTLIELLAVIIILGIILSIATLAVATLINDSRDKTFVNSAKSFIEAAKTVAAEAPGRYYPQDDGQSTIIYITDIPTSGIGTKKDAYDSEYDLENCFIRIKNITYNYEFYITLIDKAGNKLVDVKESDLTPAIINKRVYNKEEIFANVTVISSDPTVADFEKCVIIGDINGDLRLDNKDYDLCVLVSEGKYQMVEAEYKVLTNDGGVGVPYREICQKINNRETPYTGSTSSCVKIVATDKGFNKYSNYHS